MVDKVALVMEEASRFAESATDLSMKDAVDTFAQAVERFASVKDHRKRVIDTELCKTGMILRDAASTGRCRHRATNMGAAGDFFSGLLRCGC